MALVEFILLNLVLFVFCMIGSLVLYLVSALFDLVRKPDWYPTIISIGAFNNES